jgi:predicted nucleic acid-binding protein
VSGHDTGTVPDVPPVVVDTNLFVAAGFNPASGAARVLALVRAGALRLVWDESTRRETEHVVRAIPPLAGTDLSDLFRPDGRYDGPTSPGAFGHVPDPDDRKFAALAAVAGVVLLTNDRHPLNGRPHPGLVVLTPVEFIWQLRAEGPGGRPRGTDATSGTPGESGRPSELAPAAACG